MLRSLLQLQIICTATTTFVNIVHVNQQQSQREICGDYKVTYKSQRSGQRRSKHSQALSDPCFGDSGSVFVLNYWFGHVAVSC